LQDLWGVVSEMTYNVFKETLTVKPYSLTHSGEGGGSFTTGIHTHTHGTLAALATSVTPIISSAGAGNEDYSIRE